MHCCTAAKGIFQIGEAVDNYRQPHPTQKRRINLTCAIFTELELEARKKREVGGLPGPPTSQVQLKPRLGEFS